MNSVKYIALLATLSALSACDPNFLRAPTMEDDCHRQAQERVKLYDKPDIYPISEAEHQEALNSLFNACMSGNTYQKEVDNTHIIPEPPPPPPPPNVPPPDEITVTNESPPPFEDTTRSRMELENVLTRH